MPGAERVEQSDWANPTLSEWTANLAEAILRKPGVVLVAHSLGCALTAHFARVTGGRGVAAALLVAPADVDRSTIRGRLMDEFSPMPRRLLPFASTVVASRTDPFVDLARARTFAGDWGSRFTDLGDAGHINVDSGHGPWAEGRRLLDALIHQAASLQH